ncbi:DUF4250 domain-containing protein [Flavonifractor sp. An112]|uniref:DUF4250 domain-containing protein n=1 Tax=Flavonifractor sp. An112 TaxID=1965544 RepID=UPI001748B388|nr:DUF4250 domain-containing protein [Flavonifractor sp. An112]HIZ93913.1 DUF4250 domain-containing protein [Candidatus Flavonifractor avicola]
MLPQDPMILLSYVNTKLRDFYPSLDSLCDDLQVDQDEISQKLSILDCQYDPHRNQFVRM